jgi:hypothetical protein
MAAAAREVAWLRRRLTGSPRACARSYHLAHRRLFSIVAKAAGSGRWTNAWVAAGKIQPQTTLEAPVGLPRRLFGDMRVSQCLCPLSSGGARRSGRGSEWRRFHFGCAMCSIRQILCARFACTGRCNAHKRRVRSRPPDRGRYGHSKLRGRPGTARQGHTGCLAVPLQPTLLNSAMHASTGDSPSSRGSLSPMPVAERRESAKIRTSDDRGG